MPWKFTHQPCKGTGRIQNPDFEFCRTMPEPPKNCDECRNECRHVFKDCQKGEMIDCPECHGTGELILEGEEWGSPEWF